MRRLAALCLITVTFSVPALAATRARTAKAPIKTASADPADIAAAKADPASLFNNPAARIQTSDTGGHIATLATAVTAFNSATRYGAQQSVQVEVTDPFGYYAKPGQAAPQAVLANISYDRTAGPEGIEHFQTGTNDTLTRTASGSSYRGDKVTFTNTTEVGDDIALGLTNLRVSVAGQNGWNSRDGQNYSVQAP